MPPPNLRLEQSRRSASRLSRILDHFEHFTHLIDQFVTQKFPVVYRHARDVLVSSDGGGEGGHYVG